MRLRQRADGAQPLVFAPLAEEDDGGSGQVEAVTLAFAKVDLEYRPQKQDGSLDAGIHFKYDLKAQKDG